MKRIAFFVYGVSAYAFFLATFLYTAGFLTNLGVPKSIDGPARVDPQTAIATNLILLTLFALQHSGMARPGWKRVWTQIVPEPIERATYVLFSNLALIGVMVYWQPIEGTLWHFESGLPYAFGLIAFAFGVSIVLYSTLLIDHLDLFGLRQVFAALKKRPAPESTFVVPSLYQFVRHPLYVGWFITLWATPSMTMSHLLFALVGSLYMVIAVRYEERDLVDAFGRAYERYQDTTPMLIPSLSAATAHAQSRTEASRGRAPHEVTRTLSL
ncbi:MAG: methanethiol S-methyltransferase [Myxococcota bacterium]